MQNCNTQIKSTKITRWVELDWVESCTISIRPIDSTILLVKASLASTQNSESELWKLYLILINSPASTINAIDHDLHCYHGNNASRFIVPNINNKVKNKTCGPCISHEMFKLLIKFCNKDKIIMHQTPAGQDNLYLFTDYWFITNFVLWTE